MQRELTAYQQRRKEEEAQQPLVIGMALLVIALMIGYTAHSLGLF
jgi:hypothetical protein